MSLGQTSQALQSQFAATLTQRVNYCQTREAQSPTRLRYVDSSASTVENETRPREKQPRLSLSQHHTPWSNPGSCRGTARCGWRARSPRGRKGGGLACAPSWRWAGLRAGLQPDRGGAAGAVGAAARSRQVRESERPGPVAGLEAVQKKDHF